MPMVYAEAHAHRGAPWGAMMDPGWKYRRAVAGDGEGRVGAMDGDKDTAANDLAGRLTSQADVARAATRMMQDLDLPIFCGQKEFEKLWPPRRRASEPRASRARAGQSPSRWTTTTSTRCTRW